MPNTSYSDALKEASALADTKDVFLDTLELSHPDATTIYLVNDRVDLIASLETTGNPQVTFERINFGWAPPKTGSDGLQQLSFSLNNVDQRITDFLNIINDTGKKTDVTHRIYFAGQLPSALPENNPPTTLVLTDVEMDAFEVRARASFSNVVTLKYPTEFYDRKRFPSLSN